MLHHSRPARAGRHAVAPARTLASRTLAPLALAVVAGCTVTETAAPDAGEQPGEDVVLEFTGAPSADVPVGRALVPGRG